MFEIVHKNISNIQPNKPKAPPAPIATKKEPAAAPTIPQVQKLKPEPVKITKEVETAQAKKSEPLANDADEKKKLLQEQIKQRLSEISNEKSDAKNNPGNPPDEKKKPELNPNFPARSTNEIIDNFIETEPRISQKKDKVVPEGDLSEKSVENQNFASETLAKIYDKQSKFDKAIETYEKLILKFPEKNTYFANQIQLIKQKNKR